MRSLVAVLVVLSTLLGASSARANPSFARRYRTSCRTCHAWSFPYLNAYGVRFRQNGYQLPEGAEDPARAAAMIEPGTLDERTAIFATPPLSVRARLLGEWTEVSPGTHQVGGSVPYARLVGGGSLYEDVSLLFSADLVPTPALHFLTLGFHNLLPHGALSLVAGQLLMTGFQRPGHRSITRVGNPLAAVHVGDNPFVLEGTHLGISLQGRPRWGPISYELALAEGSPGQRNQTGAGAPGLLGRAGFTMGGQTFGLFGYGAIARLRVDEGGVEHEWDDRLILTGADAELSVSRLLFYAAGIYGLHRDPHGEGEAIHYFGVRAEVLWALTDELSAIARYDAVESPDATLRHRLATLHVGYLILTSLRLSVEGTADLQWLGEGGASSGLKNETRVSAFVETAL